MGVCATVPLNLMMKSSQPPVSSIAVALLAVAVIVLAIKEPQCDCKSSLPLVETPTSQQASPQRPSTSGRQRELRKF